MSHLLRPHPASLVGSAERSEQVIAMARDDDAAPSTIVSSTKEERLLELAELHTKGAITDDEHAAARAKILAE